VAVGGSGLEGEDEDEEEALQMRRRAFRDVYLDCVPGGGCSFLCEDAGPQYARNLCRSFPGNTWWRGKNAFNSSLFVENNMGPDYELEIYIKGVDGRGLN
jgi:hypothetical protein